ncbi:MAG: peptidoglycan-associated lipoprotein Pal [Alphaproteobacteria bacterium]|nr:peptidoglycan-associated lipoprotein Pal [Alphaproteobacteria bacterium]
MRMKLFGLMAAMLLVAGCTENADNGDTTQGGGEVAPTPVADTPVALDPQEDLVVNVGDRIFFDFDKSNLRPDAIDQLNRQADWLKMNGGITVAIEGHCDERGTREYNLALGDRRASSASQYLRSMGVDGGRIETISYGKERPAVLGSNEEAWAQNRRAVMVVKSGSLS